MRTASTCFTASHRFIPRGFGWAVSSGIGSDAALLGEALRVGAARLGLLRVVDRVCPTRSRLGEEISPAPAFGLRQPEDEKGQCERR